MKKAMLLTLGMLLLSSLIFSMAILLFHNTQGTESRFAEISLYDRLYDLDRSIQRGFGEIFHRNSGMTLAMEDDIVLITETLPHSSNFAAEMDAYEDYLEEKYAINPVVTISDSVLEDIKNGLPFYIRPHNILIDHSSFPSGNLEITPSSLNIENYSISLTTTKQSVTLGYSGMHPGSFPVRISVVTDSGTSVRQDNIDPLQTHTWTLTFDEGLPSEATITITINNPAQLIINRGTVTADHNIDVALEHQVEEMNYITYPADLFTINFPTDSLQKTNTARII